MSEITVIPARSIITMDPSQPVVEAVAVREGKILAAGSLDECTSWGRTPSTPASPTTSSRPA
ncbi:MAG: hypothetical protein O3B90_04760 [Actinomycetota bacterium]|nr:hypothetical protein [Actinomycetota bacterium]